MPATERRSRGGVAGLWLTPAWDHRVGVQKAEVWGWTAGKGHLGGTAGEGQLGEDGWWTEQQGREGWWGMVGGGWAVDGGMAGEGKPGGGQ